MFFSRSNIGKTALIIVVFSILSQIFGYMRDLLIAARFGAGWITDAFFIAYLIPTFLQSNLFFGGIFSAAFIPVFTNYFNNKNEEARGVAINSFLWLFSISFFIGLIFLIGGKWIVILMAPGLKIEGIELAGHILQIMALVVLLNCISGFLMALLNSFKHFLIPALTAFLLNFAIVVLVFMFSERMGIYSLVIGVVIGSFIQILFLIPPSFKRINFSKFQVDFNLFHPAAKEINGLLVILGVGAFIGQLRQIMEKIFASNFAPGTITQLQFAFRIYSIPLVLFAAPLATISLPLFSEKVSLSGVERLKTMVSKSIKFIFVLTVPCIFGFLVISLPLVRLLFQHGEFDGYASETTARALGGYAIGLSAQAMTYVIMQAYYSIKDVITPLKATLIGFFSYGFFALYLSNAFGPTGIALSYAITNIIVGWFLVWMLYRKLGGLEEREIFNVAIKVLIASIMMTFVLIPSLSWVDFAFKRGLVWETGAVFGLVVVGAIVYIGTCLLLNVKEINLLWEIIVNKIRSGLESEQNNFGVIMSRDEKI